jgi:hypothetical protein
MSKPELLLLTVIQSFHVSMVLALNTWCEYERFPTEDKRQNTSSDTAKCLSATVAQLDENVVVSSFQL